MSNVQTAVARRDEERAQTPAQVSIAEQVKSIINRQAGALSAVLPEHLEIERYSRLTLTAIKANPTLMAAFRTEQGQLSVLLSVMQAAGLGLEPNTPTQECWLQPRKNQGVDECELSIGYKGYAKLARRSGTVKELIADVVRQGDEFDYSRGLNEDTFHHKKLTDDGDLTHAYCIARFTNGGAAFTVLTRKEVEKRRDQSESWKNDRARPYSPWTKWTEEMWRKTAIRNLLTHGEVDLSPELLNAASTDETPLHVGADGTIDALVLEDPVGELGRGEQSDEGLSAGASNGAPATAKSPPPSPGDGDRQEPASPSTFAGEGEPADAGPPSDTSEGSPPASDGTVDPAAWTEQEWRKQLSARKIKVPDALTQAQRFAVDHGIEPGPTSIDELVGSPVAGDVAAWMGL